MKDSFKWSSLRQEPEAPYNKRDLPRLKPGDSKTRD